MYLCMARIAHREGYPEIGLYWGKGRLRRGGARREVRGLLGEDSSPT